MNEDSLKFKQLVAEIIKRDHRYRPEAYAYVSAGVSRVAEIIAAKGDSKRHISGEELTDGLRQLLLQDFDNLAFDVLKFWGISNTEDFGNIVFNLVDMNLLGVSSEDSIEDFRDKGDFYEMFVAPFHVIPETDAPMPQIKTRF